MADKYNDVALHFDILELPPELGTCLYAAPVSLADLGSGDGPWFRTLHERGLIGPSKPVYAVDLEHSRLARVARRFPWITLVEGPADHAEAIPSNSVEVVISTMVMEHVPDERAYLKEIERILAPGGNAYVSTVFKRPWAWYFRRRDGECVLDTSHLREYQNLEAFRSLIASSCSLGIQSLTLEGMWFPLLDPLLHRMCHYIALPDWLLAALRTVKVPIVGYFELRLVLAKAG